MKFDFFSKIKRKKTFYRNSVKYSGKKITKNNLALIKIKNSKICFTTSPPIQHQEQSVVIIL